MGDGCPPAGSSTGRGTSRPRRGRRRPAATSQARHHPRGEAVRGAVRVAGVGEVRGQGGAPVRGGAVLRGAVRGGAALRGAARAGREEEHAEQGGRRSA